MGRTGWLAVVALVAVGVGVGLRLHTPSTAPALPCPPDEVRWVDEHGTQVARCAPDLAKSAVPVAQVLAVGQKLDLNTASEAELAALPGIGPSLAHALVHARDEARFSTWDDVDRVPGIGPSKLAVLKAHAVVGPDR